MTPVSTVLKQRLGRWGEAVACRWLRRQGHVIIGRNVRRGHLECDLVTVRDGVIHFVEVKTARYRRSWPAGLALRWQQQQRVEQFALQYLSGCVAPPEEWRILWLTIEPRAQGQVLVRQGYW